MSRHSAWIHHTDRLLARLASHGKDFSRLARLTQSESRNNPESQYRRSPRQPFMERVALPCMGLASLSRWIQAQGMRNQRSRARS